MELTSSEALVFFSWIVVSTCCFSAKYNEPPDAKEIFNFSRMYEMEDTHLNVPYFMESLLHLDRSSGEGLPYQADTVKYFANEVSGSFEGLAKFQVTINPDDTLRAALIQVTYIDQAPMSLHGNLQRLVVSDVFNGQMLVNRLVLPVRPKKGPSYVSTFVTTHVSRSLKERDGHLLYRFTVKPAGRVPRWNYTSNVELYIFTSRVPPQQTTPKALMQAPILLGPKSTSRQLSQRRLVKGCKLADLKVDFQKLGFKHVLAPPGYNAKQCSGGCHFPFGTGAKATNHAMIQSIMWSILAKGGNAREVQCVPTALGPMKILYVDKDKSLIVREFQNMVAVECGCR